VRSLYFIRKGDGELRRRGGKKIGKERGEGKGL